MGTLPGRLLAACAVGLAALTTASTLLADLGWFRWWLTVPLALAPAVAAGLSGRRSGAPPITLGAAAGAGVAVLVVGSTVLAGLMHGQHLLTDRDPGVYAVTAEWLAREGTLEMPAAVAPFDDPRLDVTTQGFTDREGDAVLPQFVHGWPAVLATVNAALGTRAMLLVPALVTGLALALFGAFASNWLRPGAVVGAVAVLGASLPLLYFGRDTYSEPLVLALGFGGLWLLTAPAGDDGRAFDARVLGAFVIAAACLVRIDAVFLLSAVIVVAAGVWRAGARRRVTRMAAAAALPVAIAALDLAWRSPEYLRYQRGELLAEVVATLLVGAAVAAAPWIGGRWRARTTTDARTAAHLRAVAAGLAAAVVIGLAVWFVVIRPAVVEIRGGAYPRYIGSLQQAEGVPLDPTRTYAEQAGRWLAWYLGPVVAAGALGAALAVHRILRPRKDRSSRSDGRDTSGTTTPPAGFLTVFALVTLVYLQRPSIVADQMWATRRFLPVTIPGLVLLGAWATGELGSRLRIGSTPAGPLLRTVGTAAAAMALAFELFMAWPLLGARDQLGMLRATDRLCAALPADAAVLVAADGRLDATLPATLRARCGVPAAVVRGDGRAGITASLLPAARRAGRELWVVAGSPARLVEAGGAPGHPEGFRIETNNPKLAAETLTRPPRRLVSEVFVFLGSPASRPSPGT